MNATEAEAGTGAGAGHRALSRGLRLLVLCGVGFVCGAAQCDGGGAYSCQACRDACEQAGIRAADCNCQGCTPP